MQQKLLTDIRLRLLYRGGNVFQNRNLVELYCAHSKEGNFRIRQRRDSYEILFWEKKEKICRK